MISLKKLIKAGKNFSVNTKKDENPDVMEWINLQSNLSDSIRFLIEQDIRLFGILNLQQIIPANREPDYIIHRKAININSDICEIEKKANGTVTEKMIQHNDITNTGKAADYNGIPKEDIINSWE